MRKIKYANIPRKFSEFRLVALFMMSVDESI